MKGNAALLKTLNGLLARELTVISQYIVHAEVCENWGYDKLHGMIRSRAITEMKHAEALIARIIFLEGIPIVSKLNDMHIGAEVPKMMANDLRAEMDAVKLYNAGIAQAVEVGDNATRELLESILKDEDDHVDKIEEQRDQIEQMGLPLYLASMK